MASPEPLVQIQKLFHKIVPYDVLYQNFTSGDATLNKLAASALDKEKFLNNI